MSANFEVPTLRPDVGHPATEGAHGIQTRFRESTFVVVEKWASLAHLEATAPGRTWPPNAAGIKDLIASWVIHVLSAA